MKPGLRLPSPRQARPLARRSAGWLAYSLVLITALGSGCDGCEKAAPVEVLSLAPGNAAMIAHVPQLGALVQGAEVFVTRLTAKAGSRLVQPMRDGLKKQLGVDPLSTEGLKNLGLDGARGALVFFEGNLPAPLLALPVADRAIFDKQVKDIFARLDGADRTAESKVGGFTVSSIGRPFGDEVVPVALWAHVGTFVLAARAEGEPALRAALTRLGATPPDSAAPVPGIADDPSYKALAAKVPGGLLRVFGRGSLATTLGGGALAGFAVDSFATLDLGVQGLSLDSVATLPGLESALAGAPAAELVGLVAEDAVVVGVSRAAGPAGVEAVEKHPRGKEWVGRGLGFLQDQIGVDPKAEVLPQLVGPVVGAVHLGDLATVGERLKLRSSRALLDLVQPVVIAEIKDPAAMLAVLDKSQKALAARNHVIVKSTKKYGGQTATVYAPKIDPAPMGWAVLGNRYIYAAGTGRLDRALQRLADGPSELPKSLASSTFSPFASAPGTSVLTLRGGALAQAAQNIGGGGLGIGQLIGTGVEILRTLGDVTVALSAEPEGLRLRVKQKLE